MKKIIFVEGNIGSGKTSALDFLGKYDSPGTLVIREPVSEWQNMSGHNILDLMYTDPEKYGFSFQCYVFVTRVSQLLSAMKIADTIIAERSIFTDKNIFMEMLYRLGKINEPEKIMYVNIWNYWTELLEREISNSEISFLYIRCDSDKCHDHIVKRSRNEETKIELSYLKGLETLHENNYNVKEVFFLKKFREISVIENQGDSGFFHQIEEFFNSLWENWEDF